MYILAGGSDSQYPSYWEQLARVVNQEGENDKVILSCMFSREPSERPIVHRRFDELFAQYLPGTKQIIHAEEESFYDQISQANVIYLHGGSTEKLIATIPDTERFKSAIDGKIVIGSSAGANFLSTTCFSPSKEEVISSTGILPVGVVVHYGINEFDGRNFTKEFWKHAVEEVQEDLGSDQILLLLPEGQFAVIHS